MQLASFFLLLLFRKALLVKVETKSGVVVGAELGFGGLRRNGTYFSFQGIPYAQPPLGKLRFHDPVPVESWNDEVDASDAPPAMCVQPPWFDPTVKEPVTGEEDCLFLNIYTEELPQSGLQSMELKPVMFWIHGGGFMLGSGAMLGDGSGSDFLIESGMVVVTINYRLGPLGFLALEGTSITGNQGLKDQLLALRWVKENIANFGGDPGRITIAGESAGAVSVHAQVLSPMGKDEDLFHRAISFSGTMLMDYTEGTKTQSRDYIEKLVKSGEFTDGGIENIEEDIEDENSWLYTVSANTLILKATQAYMSTSKLSPKEQVENTDLWDNTYVFFPVIDDWAEEPFLPSHPITILHNQQQKMVPFMTGINKDEGAMNIAPKWKHMDPADNQLAEYFGTIGARELLFSFGKDITFDDQLTAKTIAHFYVGKDGISRENKQGLMDMYTDAYFAHPNTEVVRLHAQSPVPVYNYLMSYRGSASFAPLYAQGDQSASQEDFGVAHGDDLMYFFKIAFGNYTTINTENDEKFVEIWQQLMVNFARYGDPTPVKLPNIPNWPPAQKSKAACVYLDIGLEPAEKHRMFSERMHFWHKLFFADRLEKFAISEQESVLMAEIGDAVEESEDEEDNEDNNKKNRKFKGKQGKWKKKQHKRRNMKQKTFRKQRRLAKKLRQLKCN